MCVANWRSRHRQRSSFAFLYITFPLRSGDDVRGNWQQQQQQHQQHNKWKVPKERLVLFMFPYVSAICFKCNQTLISPYWTKQSLIWFQLAPSWPGRQSAVILEAIDHRDDHCDRHLVSWGGYAIWWLACAINQPHRFIGLIKVLSAWSTCATWQRRRGNFHSTLVRPIMSAFPPAPLETLERLIWYHMP